MEEKYLIERVKKTKTNKTKKKAVLMIMIKTYDGFH